MPVIYAHIWQNFDMRPVVPPESCVACQATTDMLSNKIKLYLTVSITCPQTKFQDSLF